MSDGITFGELYKKMRTERKILQQKCCEEIIDKKGLWNFESGRTTPSFTRILMLLEKINVPLTEFIYHFESQNDDFIVDKKLKILDNWENFFSMPPDSFRDTISNFFEEYEKTGEQFYLLYSSSLKVLYNNLHGSYYRLSEVISVVSDYLFLIENPTKFEYLLFINTFTDLSGSLISIYDSYIETTFSEYEEEFRFLFMYYIRRIRALMHETGKNELKIESYLDSFGKYTSGNSMFSYFFEKLYYNFLRHLFEEWRGNYGEQSALMDLLLFEYFLKEQDVKELRRLYDDVNVMHKTNNDSLLSRKAI